MAEVIAPTATFVTDPCPRRRRIGPACEFKIYPTPDEVEFCENAAVAVLIAPCCGQTTNVCRACIDKMPTIGWWLCLGCGLKTECKWTPMTFGIRWL